VQVLKQAQLLRRLVVEGLANDRNQVMGAYELMEGKVVSGRAVWQKQGGGQRFRLMLCPYPLSQEQRAGISCRSRGKLSPGQWAPGGAPPLASQAAPPRSDGQAKQKNVRWGRTHYEKLRGFRSPQKIH
jgi:hypothetical protein